MKKFVILALSMFLLLAPFVCFVGCGGSGSSVKKCQTCNGVGRYDECATCRGSGKVLDTYVVNGQTEIRYASQEDKAKGFSGQGFASDYRMKHCEACSGTGTRQCGDCNGRGTLLD